MSAAMGRQYAGSASSVCTLILFWGEGLYSRNFAGSLRVSGYRLTEKSWSQRWLLHKSVLYCPSRTTIAELQGASLKMNRNLSHLVWTRLKSVALCLCFAFICNHKNKYGMSLLRHKDRLRKKCRWVFDGNWMCFLMAAKENWMSVL